MQTDKIINKRQMIVIIGLFLVSPNRRVWFCTVGEGGHGPHWPPKPASVHHSLLFCSPKSFPPLIALVTQHPSNWLYKLSDCFPDFVFRFISVVSLTFSFRCRAADRALHMDSKSLGAHVEHHSCRSYRITIGLIETCKMHNFVIRPPDIVCRRTYILPVFLSSSFFLSFFFFAA